ncbi:MAG: VWA domain-containing protein [Mucinivorans sp.]
MFTRFANPDFLWLLLVLPLMVVYYIYRTRQGGATITISSLGQLSRSATRTAIYYLRHLPFVLRLAAVALIIVAIARPQTSLSGTNSNAEGIDIVMALDISGSMLARDFQPDRFNAAKEISGNFIIERPTDRIGLVVFAGEAFTQSPLTTDHVSLVNLLQGVQMGTIADGTAIGNGLATAVNRLKESQAKSKVIVLLTDGVNNSGQIDPQGAADIAKEFGIRVYTIGVGTQGYAPFPAYDAWGNIVFQNAKVEIDEPLMRSIADKTGGRYFRATDNTKLAEIYAEINQLEKTKVEVENFTKYTEVFHPFLLLALLLVLLEMGCRYFVFKQIP